MVNYPTILNLPQEDINRQLYEMIVKAQAGDDAALKEVADDIKDIQEAIPYQSIRNCWRQIRKEIL